MKKTTLFVCAMLIATVAMGVDEKYYQKMGETLSEFSTCSSVEDYQNLANKFRVIANVEKEEWLPLYYEAHCYVLISFMGDLTALEKDSYLDKASTLIESMTELAPNEAEVQVMTAFHYTGSLVVNPPQRAMSTTPLIHAAIAKALVIEPNNPRALFLRISNEMGTASYFGEDIAPYCEQATELLQNWDAYELKSPIHPSWGKEEIEGIVHSCGE
ncbi:MAG: hypothetical protein U9R49_00050 [Bacteroidota bacterium]|nr:hypothetical protein [Bacteroidota bacterium]